MEIITRCPFCGREHVVVVDIDGYMAWKYDGVSVQDAFPHLSADERELLITGICAECWENVFGGEEDE